jgi:hypothetical protein
MASGPVGTPDTSWRITGPRVMAGGASESPRPVQKPVLQPAARQVPAIGGGSGHPRLLLWRAAGEIE